ncbi:MGDG synthase family glycosyltransferase [Ornithinibacillus halophilus]|uniref:UDP-N-acetylglucosamine:LPS N-acetylglucosamine transferase n=1 Tax=Ornithinibacillus halophilus TaxID=930117 RepID=A0A1M5N921_9BACI|nr:glycosyltransferase [Ornithinibacillus halophilus]SHG85513.1 UDP-N-acetylglucosamine:LPS N-acetylglucosamine transferase [Ornithinibacillus halophilus]
MISQHVSLVIEGIKNGNDGVDIMQENPTREALFLPFMQIPTGHHHVADTLMEYVQKTDHPLNCRKIDILSYSFGRIESVVSGTYLKWINALPQAYDGLYRYLAVKNLSKRKRQHVYEMLFSYSFKKLLQERSPTILFCTHALPSNLASVLKKKKQLDSIVVNVYTDYFVNRVWGIDGIDYHFAPTVEVKDFLLDLGVAKNKIFITGIPVHEAFHMEQNRKLNSKRYSILVTGGSLGVGRMEKLITRMEASKDIDYYILCGKNEKLYQTLHAKNVNHINPISYVESKWEMNELYNKVDAVITKAGGVTISECLMKKKPIFVCHALPGQEKVNEDRLKKLGLVIPLEVDGIPIDQQVKTFLTNAQSRKQYEQKLQIYHENLVNESIPYILSRIC